MQIKAVLLIFLRVISGVMAFGLVRFNTKSEQVGNQCDVYLQANKPWSVVQPSFYVNGL